MNKALGDEMLTEEKPIVLLSTQIRVVAETDGSNLALKDLGGGADTYGVAKVALSCLAKPRPGDRVIVQSFSNEEKIVTAVVESDDSQVEIHSDRDMAISCSGQFRINADEELVLTGRNKIQAETQQFGVKTATMIVTASIFSGTIKEVSVIGGTIEAVFKRMKTNTIDCFQSAKNLFRQTHETECVQSGSFAQKVSGSHVSEATYVAVLAKKDVRVDGERIHIG
jgi:hypothetical protein